MSTKIRTTERQRIIGVHCENKYIDYENSTNKRKIPTEKIANEA